MSNFGEIIKFTGKDEKQEFVINNLPKGFDPLQDEEMDHTMGIYPNHQAIYDWIDDNNDGWVIDLYGECVLGFFTMDQVFAAYTYF